MKIKKAIIPAAGLGTRFLPATKALAKEMLPIVDKPTIQYIVEEAAASGIEEILIVIGRGKSAIEHHFTKAYQLEDVLLRKQKISVLEEIQKISNLVTIYFLYQHEPKGLGDAILCAKSFVGDEPFAVMLGDNIIQSQIPCIQQLIDIYEDKQSSVIAVQKVEEKDISKYGIVKSKDPMVSNSLYKVHSLVEKPPVEEAPSPYAIIGRYVLTPEIFDILAQTPIGSGNELQLTDAMNELAKQQAVFSYEFEGKHYDIGDKLGFVKATVDFALQREDISQDILAHLQKRLKG